MPSLKKDHPIDLLKQKNLLIEGCSFIDSLSNQELINIPIHELNNLLKEIKKNIPKQVVIPSNANLVIEQSFEVLNEWLNQFNIEKISEMQNTLFELSNNNEFKVFLNDMLPKILNRICDLNFCVLVLFSCACITNQHVSTTRYPNQNINPLNLYTKSLEVIQKQPKFMNFLEIAIKKLRQSNNLKYQH